MPKKFLPGADDKGKSAIPEFFMLKPYVKDLYLHCHGASKDCREKKRRFSALGPLAIPTQICHYFG
jgi:hypothetical protein